MNENLTSPTVKLLKKNKDTIILICTILICYLIGFNLFIYGVQNGESLAVNMSRPMGASFWSTSNIQKEIVSYGICIFAGIWILTSHILMIFLLARLLILKKVDSKEVEEK